MQVKHSYTLNKVLQRDTCILRMCRETLETGRRSGIWKGPGGQMGVHPNVSTLLSSERNDSNTFCKILPASPFREQLASQVSHFSFTYWIKNSMRLPAQYAHCRVSQFLRIHGHLTEIHRTFFKEIESSSVSSGAYSDDHLPVAKTHWLGWCIS